MTSVCLILWFLECHEAEPYFCPPVLRLVDFHGIYCQAACPALGQGSADEGIGQPVCSRPGFKQALKTSEELGLQYSYLKNMFATLVHKQGKFLAPEKVIPANDFLEREKSGHSLWPWLAALLLQCVFTHIFLDLDSFLISSLEMSKTAIVWESFLRNNQSCIFCSPSFCLLYKKFKEKRSPERR